MSDKEITLEERFEQIESLLRSMEDPTTDLESSFEMFSKGMKLLKECNDSIDRIEKDLITLEEDSQ